MKVTFLGTGTSQGVPIIGCQCIVCQSTNNKDKRLRSSVMIEMGGKSLVIDTGPDFRQQMLRIENPRLDAVIFTHSHKDHINGFDDIRSFNYIQQGPIEVYLEEAVMTAIRRDYFYMFEEFKYPGVPEANFHIINENEFEIEGIKIVPIRVHHYRMPVLGYRVGNFTYITDANSIGDAEIEKMNGTEVLVLNALRRASHISHFSLEQAMDMVKKINPKRAYFTHISHQLGLHEEVNKELPEGMELAWDGLNVEL
ncbi:MAG: MBL fold metallo-hydrolase [Bacteroidia bacterium]